MSQMSLWSAGAREPAVADLDGLLAGPGHIAVRDDTARIGVVVANDRVDLMVTALANDLGLEAEVVDITGESGLAVRTPWLTELRSVAANWQQGALSLPPRTWVLDGPRLRWWCLAAGFGVEDPQSTASIYGLGLSPTNEMAWPAVGSALSTAGVAGAFVGPRAGGPAYRVVGQRRLHRLRELVGDQPRGLDPRHWPPESTHHLPVAP